MAITLFGVASVPTDNGTNTADPTAFSNPPVASMQTGDLCILYAYCRTSSATISINNTGGQTWNTLGTTSSAFATLTGKLFWSRFNGTWSAAPSVNFGATTNNNVVMLIFRPSLTSNLWGIDVTDQSIGAILGFAAAATTTIFFASAVPINPSTVSFALWNTDDDNTWGTLTGSGWSKTGLSAQYRNTSGNDSSSTFAYLIKTSASSIPDVSQTELTLGNDGGIIAQWVFYEYSQSTGLLPFCIAPQPTR